MGFCVRTISPLNTASLTTHTVCALCHLEYFTRDYIAFSPSVPLLRYINDYLSNTPVAEQLPLFEVFISLITTINYLES